MEPRSALARRGLPTAPQRRAPWLLLFSALVVCGGHGLLLAPALVRGGFLESPGRLGGWLAMTAVAWLVICAPLSLLAVLARRPLQRWPRLWPAVLVVTGASVASFAYYLLVLVPHD